MLKQKKSGACISVTKKKKEEGKKTNLNRNRKEAKEADQLFSLLSSLFSFFFSGRYNALEKLNSPRMSSWVHPVSCVLIENRRAHRGLICLL